MNYRLGILGGGRAAWAYGCSWRRAGWPIAGVWLREESRSTIAGQLDAPRLTVNELAGDADLLLLAVSDRALEDVATMVPSTNATIFHASGARPSIRGGFSLHPLKVLPPVGDPSDLCGALLVFEGSHRETARAIAAGIGARFAEVPREAKPLYHAGAVFGANYVAALLEIAEDLVERAGVTGAHDDLAALAISAVENWRSQHGVKRFTGPAARGDQSVIEQHLLALHDDAQVSEIYKLLAAAIARTILASAE